MLTRRPKYVFMTVDFRFVFFFEKISGYMLDHKTCLQFTVSAVPQLS